MNATTWRQAQQQQQQQEEEDGGLQEDGLLTPTSCIPNAARNCHHGRAVDPRPASSIVCTTSPPHSN
jgi:hypothetical protein